jgi:hypothetical protein
MRLDVALFFGSRVNLAISSHSAACFRNSSVGFSGVMTLNSNAPIPLIGHNHT